MARTAKKTATEAGLKAESLIEEPDVITPPSKVEISHREVRTWKEERTVDDIEDEEIDDVEDDSPEEIQPSPDDPIAKVLSEIAGSRSNWSLQVARLPNYDRDNRTDPKSRRHCGVLSIPDADYLKEERFLEDLQHKFARGVNGNWFLMCVRRDNRNFAYLSPVCVEPPLPEVMAAKAAETQNGAPINIYNPQVPTVDGFKQFISQAKQFAELRDLLLPVGFGTAQPVATNNEPLTDEKALLHILNREGDIVDNVASKLKGLMRNGGGGGEEKNVWDVVVAALTSPTLPQTIAMITQQFRQAAANPAPQAQPTEPPPQAIPPDVAAYHRLLGVITNTMRINGDVNIALNALDGFVALFPEHSANAEGFLTADTQHLLAMFPSVFPPSTEVVGMPHAAEWIDKLKAAYLGEEEEPKQ